MGTYQKKPNGPVTRKKACIRGFLWSKGRSVRRTLFFDALYPHVEAINNPPKALQDEKFSPRSPFESRITHECHLTLSGVPFIVSGWWSHDTRPNAALLRKFSYFPWQGEISVTFLGKIKPFKLSAPASLADDAVLTFIEKFCLSLQTGKPMATEGSRDPTWKVIRRSRY